MNLYWRIGSYLIAIAAAIGSLAWYASYNYDKGYEARSALQAKADLIAIEKNRKTEQSWQSKVDEANKRGEEREKKLSVDAASSRNAANKLRSDLAEFKRRMPEVTDEAIRNYASTATDVFGECTDRYTELAKKADSIRNELKTLDDAWPE